MVNNYHQQNRETEQRAVGNPIYGSKICHI